MYKMIKYKYNDETNNVVEFYVQMNKKSLVKSLNIQHKAYEYAYAVTAYLTSKIPTLEVVAILTGEDAIKNVTDTMSSLCIEQLIIDKKHYGEILALSSVMSQLAFKLNLHNYLRLPKAVSIQWEREFNVLQNKFSLAVAPYLYTYTHVNSESLKQGYLAIKVADTANEYTVYLDNQALAYLAQKFLQIQQESFESLLNIYAYALADILVSIIKQQFDWPLTLMSAIPAYLHKQQSYLQLIFKQSSVSFTCLMTGWQEINWSLLVLRCKNNIVNTNDEVSFSPNRINAKLTLPIVAGISNISQDELSRLHHGDVLLLDECYLPSSVALHLGGNAKALCLPTNNQLTVTQIIAT